MDAPARQLGRTDSPTERLAAHLDRMEQLERQRQELEAQKRLEESRRPTREQRIAAAEERSREMEQEAGLDFDENALG